MTPPRERRSRTVAVVAHAMKADHRLRTQLERAADKAGYAHFLWLETSEEDAGAGAARDALEQGVDLVVAAGGDGTLRDVAEAMRGSNVPLGIIPLGTGNLFAHNLAPRIRSIAPVVLTVPQAIKTAFGGVDREVDLGVIELQWPDGTRSEHVFLVLAGIGIDAQMIANTTPEAKRAVGVLAYVGGIVRSLRTGRSIRVHSVIDDHSPRDGSVHSLLVGNCGMLPGNIPLLPAAELDDGVFDIVTLRPSSFFGWLNLLRTFFVEFPVLGRSRAGRKIVASDGRHMRNLRYEQGRQVTVALAEPDDIEIDGEHLGKVIGFVARVDPGSLVVRVSEAP